ncbi:uncharacterized protein J3D65DRAFT_376167 [Phyllosticta citribraziliensis]|uniref:Uncharacterized protein n=1 Tax=Phyllosticta citribraziliensis TaxID=989973 RepID=A0ABR1LQ57_9PEZI
MVMGRIDCCSVDHGGQQRFFSSTASTLAVCIAYRVHRWRWYVMRGAARSLTSVGSEVFGLQFPRMIAVLVPQLFSLLQDPGRRRLLGFLFAGLAASNLDPSTVVKHHGALVVVVIVLILSLLLLATTSLDAAGMRREGGSVCPWPSGWRYTALIRRGSQTGQWMGKRAREGEDHDGPRSRRAAIYIPGRVQSSRNDVQHPGRRERGQVSCMLATHGT